MNFSAILKDFAGLSNFQVYAKPKYRSYDLKSLLYRRLSRSNNNKHIQKATDVYI